MRKINIKAKIRRNKFDEFAGKYYRDENSEIVKYLAGLGKKALLGIQKEDGIYTIVGESSIYYLTSTGVEGEISQKDFLKLLHQNAWALGKKGDFEFLKVNEQDQVWLKDASTMSAMWNTILLLDANQEEV
jgi:hypothetical protein